MTLGVPPVPEYVIPQSFMLAHFWKGIQSGVFVEVPDHEIEELVERICFNHTPLTSLTPEEREIVDRTMVKQYKEAINREILKELCQPDLYSLKEIMSRMIGQLDVLGDTLVGKKFLGSRGLSGVPMSPADKVAIFTDPEKWCSLEYPDSALKGLQMQGYRGLWNYWALFANRNTEIDRIMDFPTEAEEALILATFPRITNSIRKRTGKSKLNMLDVGGGIGRALSQAKQLDPDLETFNMTVHEEPAMYKVDHVCLFPAECMPAEWFEQMDLVVSNVAFGYFPYADIALKNILHALSVGGEAGIGFSTNSAPISVQEQSKRIEVVCRLLERLQHQGYIALEIVAGTYMGTEKVAPDWYRSVPPDSLWNYDMSLQIIKLRSFDTLGEGIRLINAAVKTALTS